VGGGVEEVYFFFVISLQGILTIIKMSEVFISPKAVKLVSKAACAVGRT
jgi:hypothetical protein